MAKTDKNRHSERFTALADKIEETKEYEVDEAITLVKELATAKFPETVDVAIRLGIDPKKGDQNVRGTTNLPHGTGKSRKVAVLASGDKAKEAEEAGADRVGAEDLIKDIQEGYKDFDMLLATTDMAPQIGKVGKFLGPKTPNKKNGTLTDNLADTLKEIKGATRIEYRIDKGGVVHLVLGKTTFEKDQIKENFIAAFDALIKAKPPSSKGRFLRSVTISSTMGPSISIDPSDAAKVAGH